MDGLPRIGTLVLIAGLLGACSSLIGLDKFDSNEAESAGESGDSGKGGKGGGSGGSGGSSGSATMTGGAAGSMSGAGAGAGGASGKGGNAGKGGQNTSGDSGNGGVGDEGGMGPVGGKGGKGGSGGKAGTGGTSGTGGDVGTGGELGCSEVIEITATGAYSESGSGTFASYSYDLSPQIYGPDPDFGALPDYLWLDFYAGAEYTGDLVGQTFPLGVDEEENYASCSRCVWLGVDFGYATDPPDPTDCNADPDNCKTLSAQYFFATSGTLEIAANSDQMNGYPNATLTDVTLSEVTINFDASGLSKIVPGGRCLHLTTASYTTDLPPVEWECAAYAYGSGDGCDCGCGIIDPDCAGETGVGACEYCSSGGTCSLDYMCHGVDLYDNSICSGVQPWTCDPRHFGDPYGNCDCGCGIQDPDCTSLDASACTYCDDPDSCTAAATGTCADLLPADNTTCQ